MIKSEKEFNLRQINEKEIYYSNKTKELEDLLNLEIKPFEYIEYSGKYVLSEIKPLPTKETEEFKEIALKK